MNNRKGTALLVPSEVEGAVPYSVDVLPVSALIELTAVTVFAVNMGWTFAKPPVVVPGPFSQYAE